MKKLLLSLILLMFLFTLASCNKKYVIAYFVDNQLYKTQEYDKNEQITLLTDVSKEGHQFNGWTLKDGTAFNETLMPKKNIELYAKFTKNTYKVTFQSLGKVIGEMNIEYNSEIYFVPDPVLEYHNFVEWRYDDGTPYNNELMPGKDITLYAHFEETEKVEKVVINLKNGSKIYVCLYPEVAPKTVENFLKLVDNDYYDNVCFHRIIDNFMIQTGAFSIVNNSIVGKPTLDPIYGEFASNGFENNLKHEVGVISMARTSVADSATSQFFICTADSPHLDGDYAAFGRVCDYESLKIVMEIGKTKTYYINPMFANFPIYAIVIESIERA